MLIKINFTVSQHSNPSGRYSHYQMKYWRNFQYTCEEVMDINLGLYKKSSHWNNGLHTKPIKTTRDPRAKRIAIYQYSNFMPVLLPENCDELVKEQFIIEFTKYINEHYKSGLTPFQAHRTKTFVLKALNINIDITQYKESVTTNFFTRFNIPDEISLEIQNYLSLQDIKNIELTCK
ncbi:Uncharacterised protein [Legionella busanensis]|uniref:F-box domain-containing protein n=1 Tax=Legionella busanensis TaxID=190655 RepID=A0A378JQW1_9GAMM|nr:hypothetical protein [Legionella busanensis]STX52569.1 Uncharacterised protein [Legionella busanensis]